MSKSLMVVVSRSMEPTSVAAEEATKAAEVSAVVEALVEATEGEGAISKVVAMVAATVNKAVTNKQATREATSRVCFTLHLSHNHMLTDVQAMVKVAMVVARGTKCFGR
jgi:hypothetical protein